jgi:D-alanyl-D-alanine carboxypeptidase
LLDKAYFEKNPDMQMPMASTTKIMTAFIAIEKCSLDEQVRIKREYTLIEGSSMYLKEGTYVSMNDLLHGLLLLSGNDAAEAIACHVAGSRQNFVGLMNEKARDLQLSGTHFENPSGLDGPQHRTTAYDLARLSAKAMENPVFTGIVSKKYYKTENAAFKNHNKLLWLYDKCNGGKTGFTKKSGRCLVTSAQQDGRLLIAVTLNASDDWNDHKRLFESFFSGLKKTMLKDANEKVMDIPVISGEEKTAGIAASKALSVSLTDAERDRVKLVIEGPRFIYAPKRSGDAYGTLKCMLGDKMIGKTDLIFAEDIPEAVYDKNIFDGFLYIIEYLFRT